MKKSRHYYDEIVDYDFIRDNYIDICKKTKHRNKIVKFDMFYSLNINNIYRDLKNRTYKHSKYNVFLIKDPKYRIVMSEGIKDKVINHIVSNKFLKDTIYPKLIDENVATRVGKGTSEAIRLCKKYFLRMNNKYENFYVLKFDISKYFYNIDHEILKSKLEKIYTDKEILHILFEIIDSTDYDYINEEIDKFINKEIDRLKSKNCPAAESKIEELKKIPHYKKGKGLGIGSLTNQIYAVFYLNELDHYIKEKLGVREYIRFMDDGIIFSNDKEFLRRVKVDLERIVKNLRLELNDKTRIYSSKEGFEFVGYRFISKNGKLLMRVKNSTKNKMKRKLLVLPRYDEEKYVRVKASYKGVIQYCTCKSLYNKYYK